MDSRPTPSPKIFTSLEGLEWLAWLMDRAFTIPGTRYKVGLDALIGLFPVGGDILAGMIQVAIVLAAVLYFRVPKAVAARMAANVLLDVGLGTIPLVGDGFDAVFKANSKNVKLLTEVQEQRAHHRPVATLGSWLFLGGLAFVLIGALILILFGFVFAVALILKKFVLPAA